MTNQSWYGEIEVPEGKFVLDFYALYEYERMTNGKNAFEAIARINGGKGTITDIMDLLHAASRRYQPEFTVADVSDVMVKNPGLLGQLLFGASPEAEENEEATASGNKKKGK